MPPKSEIDRDLIQLEAGLKRLEAEQTMFFAGRLPRPPWESRARVEALVKRLDRMHIPNTAERFRFSTLQARFTAFCDLWERALRAKEEGRPLPGRLRAAGPAATAERPAPAAATPEPAAQRQGGDLVHVATFSNPASESNKVQELYERVAEARRATGEANVPYERFRELVQHQVAKLSEGGEVAFRVALKDGKVNLTVRPVNSDEE